MLEAVRLPVTVGPMAVLDTMPWLEPLSDLVTRDKWGIAVLSRTTARLLRGGRGGLSEFATLDDASDVGHVWHGSGADRRHRPFAHLVIVARAELQRSIEASLDQRLNEVREGMIAADLEQASAVEISRIVTPVVDGVERARERALLVALDQPSGRPGSAAAGFDDVLSALEQRRAEVLLIAEGSSLSVGLCPRCRRTSTTAGRCRLDGAPR